MYRDRKKILATPKTAIAIKCIECVCGDRAGITGCTDQGCPLYRFRPKSWPKTLAKLVWSDLQGELVVMVHPKTRELSEKTKAEAASRLKGVRRAKTKTE